MNLVSFKKSFVALLSLSSAFAAADVAANTLECPHGTTKIVQALYDITSDGVQKVELAKYLDANPTSTDLPPAIYSETMILPASNFDLNGNCAAIKSGVFVKSLNYDDAEGSAAEINSIVSTKTKGMIPGIVTAADFPICTPTAATILHIAHLNTAWQDKFTERRIEFTLPNGEKKFVTSFGLDWTYTTPFVETSTGTVVMFTSKDNVKLLLRLDAEVGKTGPISPEELDVLNSRMSIFKGLKDGVACTFTGAEYEPDFAYARHIAVPTFKIQSEIDLTKTLTCLPTGEFNVDLFTDAYQVYISKCTQKNVLEVSKDGMKAASASGLVMHARGGPIREYADVAILFNRPFTYMVGTGDLNNFTTLFTGSVNDPTA